MPKRRALHAMVGKEQSGGLGLIRNFFFFLESMPAICPREEKRAGQRRVGLDPGACHSATRIHLILLHRLGWGHGTMNTVHSDSSMEYG